MTGLNFARPVRRVWCTGHDNPVKLGSTGSKLHFSVMSVVPPAADSKRLPPIPELARTVNQDMLLEFVCPISIRDMLIALYNTLDDDYISDDDLDALTHLGQIAAGVKRARQIKAEKSKAKTRSKRP